MADIKLFKLAAEINISKDSIVEYLHGKGFAIDNKPLAKLSGDMVDAVYDKFKKEKKTAEAQRNKLQKHKDFKKAINSDESDYDQDYYEPATAAQAPIAKVEAPAPVAVAPVERLETPVFVAPPVEKPAPVKKEQPKAETKVAEKTTEVKIDLEEKPKAKKVTKAKSIETAVPVATASAPVAEVKQPAKVELAKEPVAEVKAEKIEIAAKIEEQPITKISNKPDYDVIQPISSESQHKVGDKVDLSKFNTYNTPQRGYQGSRPNDRNRDGRPQAPREGGFNRDNNANRDNRPPRPQGDRPQGDRPQGDRPAGGNYQSRDGRPQAPREGGFNRDNNANRDNRPPRPQGDRPQGDRPAGGNYQSRDGRPQAPREGGFNRDNNANRDNRPPRPQGDRPAGSGDRPNYQNRDNRPPRPGERAPYQGRDNRPPQNRDNNAPNNAPRDPNAAPGKRKRMNIVEVGVGQDRNNLKGLTIVGKINLPADRPSTGNKFGGPNRGPGGGNKPDGPLKIGSLNDRIGLGKKKKKRSVREQISEVDVNRAIKQTLSGMDDTSAGSFRAKIRQKKKQEREEKEEKLQAEKDKAAFQLELAEFVTTSDLAGLMNINPNEIIIKCMQLGLMVTINQRLDKDTITLIASDYGFEVDFLDEKESQVIEDEVDDEESLLPRPPIVTIMGHVDHGKTSLLDFIRKTTVVAGESGGITQHIGAYMVDNGGKQITFLDTPGHEAFTAMRARGAQVTDIVVLVVAADDSVMPQTIEAISHSKAAGVPIIVAINKMDKPDSKPDRIKQQLADHDVLVEEWGGKNQSVEISAKFGQNIDKLLDAILLEAELKELKANPDRNARGTVIEAHMDKGLGAVTTVVVQKGSLKVGDNFVAGTSFGRVRAMFDERSNKVEITTPSHPVRVIGFDIVPSAGDSFVVVNTDSEARRIANERKQLKREQEFRQVRHITLDQISEQIKLGGVKDLYVILKADVSGSLEALTDSLQKLSHDEVRINILHKGVGEISESDVMLAKASGAIVVGFHTSPSQKAKRLADDEDVEIREYEIIYDCINDIQLAVEGMLRPVLSQVVTGTVEIRALYKISKIGTIAGCYVLTGKINRNDKVKVMRDGLEIYSGSIKQLKREKDDAKTVNESYECGILLDGFNDIIIGDIIECYKTVETKRTIKK